jgi:hypothetical protein
MHVFVVNCLRCSISSDHSLLTKSASPISLPGAAE